LARGAVSLSGSSVTTPSGARLAGRFGGVRGIAVARRELDLALVEVAADAGALVEEGVSLRRLIQENGRVVGAEVRSGAGPVRPVRAALVVGADGLRSLVARALGGQVAGWPSRHAFVAHIDGVRGMGDAAEMHVSGSGYVGLNAIGGAITNVALVVPSGMVKRAAGRTTEFFLEQLERFPGVAGRVPAPGIVRQVMVTGPFAARARRVTAPGALLVGDAADFFDPFTGEGICAALTGAELIARHVAPATRDGAAIDAALLAYRHARRRRFGGKWAVERLIGYTMEFPALFDRAVGRIGRRRGMADTLIGVTGQVLPARRVLNPLFLARMVL
jgi:flavin-dependent dehydrogenase